MRIIYYAFAVTTLLCTAPYEPSHATAIAPLIARQTGSGVTPAASHHYRRPYIVVPLSRPYGYRTYWWPQGQYHWSPFGAERWGFWCEGSGSHHLSC